MKTKYERLKKTNQPFICIVKNVLCYKGKYLAVRKDINPLYVRIYVRICNPLGHNTKSLHLNVGAALPWV